VPFSCSFQKVNHHNQYSSTVSCSAWMLRSHLCI
jgi:hypothetical protein